MRVLPYTNISKHAFNFNASQMRSHFVLTIELGISSIEACIV